MFGWVCAFLIRRNKIITYSFKLSTIFLKSFCCFRTASGTTAPSMNYRQLEEAINKWTIELEEQEKMFLQQATQVNAWDRLLIDNGEKVFSCLLFTWHKH